VINSQVRQKRIERELKKNSKKKKRKGSSKNDGFDRKIVGIIVAVVVILRKKVQNILTGNIKKISEICQREVEIN
jgi:hypothetical protein